MTEFKFVFDKNSKISIVVPELPQKCNYYYEPTDKLHKFDEVTVIYSNDDLNITIVLGKDILNEIVGVFNNILKGLISGKSQLANADDVGFLGRKLNYVFDERRKRDDFPWFSEWTGFNYTSTLMYNFDEKIYMEIAPMYPWSFDEPSEGENYVYFDEFMKTYKPYVFEIIDRKIAIQWQKQCEDILKSVDSDYLE